MHEELELLDRLDRLDRSVAKRQTEIVALRAGLIAATQTLTERQAALARATDAVAQNSAAEKAAQRLLTQHRGNRSSAVRMLETGQGDPEAAQRQLVGCEALIDDVETDVLELMEARDALLEGEAAAQAEMTTSEADVARRAEENPRVIGVLEAELAELAADRDGVHTALSRELSSKYDHWRGRDKWAVAREVRGACDTCRMEVHAQHLSDLRRGRIEPCRGCHRWLVPSEG